MPEQVKLTNNRPLNPYATVSTSLPEIPISEVAPPGETKTVAPAQEVKPESKPDNVISIPTPPKENTTIVRKSEEDWKAEIEKQKKEALSPEVEKQVEEEVKRRLAQQNIAPAPAPQVNDEAVLLEKKKRALENSNASDRIYTDNGTDDELQTAVDDEFNNDPRPKEVKEADPSMVIAGLSLCAYRGMKTAQQRLLTRWVNTLEATNQNLEEIQKELKLAKVNHKFGNANQPTYLTGVAAQAAVLAKTQGLYRIMLYNSGFWITVRPISAMDADNFVRAADSDFKELGRVLGGHYHLIMGIFLKEMALQIINNITVGSNLKDWNQPGVLNDAISIQDYDTILWALCCMMHRDGIAVGVHCTNVECKHVDDSQYVDLSKACFINPAALNAAATKWMLDTQTVRTVKDLETYRTVILHGERTITLNDGNIEYQLRVPSIGAHVTHGKELAAKLSSLLYSEKTKKVETDIEKVSFYIYQMLSPWIYKLVMKDGYGEKLFITDTEAIELSMEPQVAATKGLYNKLEDFIRDTRCTYFGLTTLECPKCHKRPNLTKEDIFPLDVEYVFFYLSYLLIERTMEQ